MSFLIYELLLFAFVIVLATTTVYWKEIRIWVTQHSLRLKYFKNRVSCKIFGHPSKWVYISPYGKEGYEACKQCGTAIKKDEVNV